MMVTEHRVQGPCKHFCWHKTIVAAEYGETYLLENFQFIVNEVYSVFHPVVRKVLKMKFWILGKYRPTSQGKFSKPSESPKRVSGRIFGPKIGPIFGRNQKIRFRWFTVKTSCLKPSEWLDESRCSCWADQSPIWIRLSRKLIICLGKRICLGEIIISCWESVFPEDWFLWNYCSGWSISSGSWVGWLWSMIIHYLAQLLSHFCQLSISLSRTCDAKRKGLRTGWHIC